MTAHDTASATDSGAADSDAERDYHPRSKRSHYLHVRISEEDRARLVALSHSRGQSGAEVIRDLIAKAADGES